MHKLTKDAITGEKQEKNQLLEKLATQIVNTEVDSYRIDKATNLMKYKMRFFQNWMRNMLPDYGDFDHDSAEHTPNLARLMMPLGEVAEQLPSIDRQWNIQEAITDDINERCSLSQSDKTLLHTNKTHELTNRILEKLATQIMDLDPPWRYRSMNLMSYKMRHFQKWMRTVLPDYEYFDTGNDENPNLVRLMSSAAPELAPLTRERDVQKYVDDSLNYYARRAGLEGNPEMTKHEQNSTLEKLAKKVVDMDLRQYDRRLDNTTNLMVYKVRFFQKWIRTVLPDYEYVDTESNESNDAHPNLARLMSTAAGRGKSGNMQLNL